MFTGIIQALGQVAAVGGGRIGVRVALGRLPRGASVAVNGVCLTVTAPTADSRSAPRARSTTSPAAPKNNILTFDLSPETLRLTNLGSLKKGDRVNIEPSLRAADFVGGHWVSGHIDERAAIVRVAPMADGCARMTIALPEKLKPFVALKGSIAVDGTSLTVTKAAPRYFETVLIPHTLRATTLGEKRAGDVVNLEADMLARYLYNLLKHSSVLK